ncbi:hypothetical protein [Peribacillus simplex]|uniref:hypothetical protein n=1 Tax=Peribacillus simplex TaxID=1478 RepID=UPI00366C07D9
MYIGELIRYSGACTSILLDMQEPKTGPANMGIPVFTDSAIAFPSMVPKPTMSAI